MEALNTAMLTSFQGITDNILAFITGIMPIGLMVVGATMGVTYGLNFFRKIIK